MKKNKQAEYNKTLLNVLSPTGLKFNKSSVTMGDVDGKIFGVTKYPTQIDYGWLSKVCNNNSSITTLSFTPVENIINVMKGLDTTIQNYQAVANGYSSALPSEQIKAEKIVKDAEQMIADITQGGVAVGDLTLTTMALSNNSNKNNNINQEGEKLRKFYISNKLTSKPMSFLQKESFENLSPFNINNKEVNQMTKQILPMSSLFGGFPLSASGYNDMQGIFFAKDSLGGIIIIDLWKRQDDRTNSNLVAMGSTGAGKSTAIKHLMSSEYEIGTKFIVIDPQGEFKEMCKGYDGDWIDATTSKINPFHIYQKTLDDEEEKSDVNWLSLHINYLEVFFKLYIELDVTKAAILKDCIQATYESKGINWETDVFKLKAEDFPIMEDLYNVILEKSEKADKELRLSETNYFKELSYLIKSSAKGSDKFLFNGHSQINPTKDFIVFDTKKLQNFSSNIKSAIYFNVLGYAQDLLTKDRNERVILVCDEAHYIIDKRVSESVAQLARIQKTCRKYESGLWTISQQMVDFLDPSIKKEGQALLEQPNVKLLMGVGKGVDLKELKYTYELTDAEEELLNQQQRGKGLLMIGRRRLEVDFHLPPHHMDIMGTGGGR